MTTGHGLEEMNERPFDSRRLDDALTAADGGLYLKNPASISRFALPRCAAVDANCHNDARRSRNVYYHI